MALISDSEAAAFDSVERALTFDFLTPAIAEALTAMSCAIAGGSSAERVDRLWAALTNAMEEELLAERIAPACHEVLEEELDPLDRLILGRRKAAAS